MRLSFGQELKQVQKQVLAPRMIQSMEVLQLPVLALQERIDQELQENPVLEIQQEEPETSDEPVDLESPDAPTVEERELVIDETQNNEDDFERLVDMDEQWPDTFEERSRPSSAALEEAGQRKLDAMANMTARPQTLEDYLHDQLSWFDMPEASRRLADRIIYNLDSNGYLQTSIEDLLGMDATEEEVHKAYEVLGLVQKLDPMGIGARDLRECLLLQLTPEMEHYEELEKLISDHLEDIEHNRLPHVVKETGYTLELIQEVLESLRKLNPKPGAIFQETLAPNVTPDVYVEQNDNGEYEVRLEEEDIPSLYISPTYRRMLMDPKTTAKDREYIKHRINSAQWLIDAILQRRSTLTKVSQAIVDHQRSFLDKGPEAIEPLKMQQIADRVGIHVTTVSRAVDDKWIQTPRGIFPLRRFFVAGTTSSDGEEVTWDAIRMKLKELIDSEDKKKPLSDDALVTELAKHGLEVARRTVTKYRKAMNIPSSRGRRDWSKK
ncbi:MAG: RNA polymerase factor sigma-54 [Planctomycetia bacterium]|jgi:RNA polymerase sigma-54 factor